MMEKNIASYDITDMMIYERMHAQSRRLYFKERFVYLRKIVGTFYVILSLFRSFVREKARAVWTMLYPTRVDFTNVGIVVYAVTLASGAASFLWFSLLMKSLG